MATAKVRLTGGPMARKCELWIDGQKVPNVAAVTIRAYSNDAVRVEMELIDIDLDVDVEAVVTVP